MPIAPYTFNPAGVSVFEGSRALPTGAYRVRIRKIEDYQKPGRAYPSFRFVLVVDEGAFAGAETLIHIGKEPNEGNRRNLKTALLSVGVPPATLEAGNVTIRESTFVEKTAYVDVTARETPDGYDDVKFCTKARWEAFRAATAAAASGRGAAPAAPHPGNAAGGQAPVDAPVPQPPQDDVLGGVLL